MRYVATPQFWRLYRQLSEEVRKSARGAYRRWLENPKHPGLRFKRVHPTEPIYSVRINRDYRAVCLLDDETAT